jgi:hydrogenase expression/formation protein HypC
MCLSIPAEVLEITGNKAKVSIGGALYDASIELLDDIKIGDFVLLHAGYAIEKINKEEADITLGIFEEIKNEL